MSKSMLRALSDFACEVDGDLILVSKGDLVHPDHPLLADSAHLFERVRTGHGSEIRTACRALDASGRLIEERRA
jgi:hypothetical protein